MTTPVDDLIASARYYAKLYDTDGNRNPHGCIATSNLLGQLADALAAERQKVVLPEIIAELDRVNEALGPSVALDDLRAWLKQKQEGV